jgi:lipopolysaccharide exporter
LEDKAIRGVPWALLTYTSSRAINILATVVLARLLVPADFGLVALAALAVDLLALSRDFGLGAALIYRQDMDDRQKGTVFTLGIGIGAVLAALIAALSPLIAEIFREPRLTEVLPVFSLTVLFSGFSGFYDPLMQRELEFRNRFISYLIQSLTYGVTAITLAAVGAGVWSLVVGQIAGVAAFSIALFPLAPYRVRMEFDWIAARDAFRTARGFLVQSTLVVLHRNVDYFAVGRGLGVAQLGFYSMAYRLGELPSWAVAEPVSKVTFPGFARMRERGEDIIPTFLSVLRIVALCACPIGMILSASAEPFTRLVFGEQWLAMIGPLAVLGLWAVLRPIWVTFVWLLNSVGKSDTVAVVFTLMLPPLIVALLVAAQSGITAVAWVLVADIGVSLLVFAFLSARPVGVRLNDQWRSLRPVIVGCVLGWSSSRAVVEAIGSDASPAFAFSASAIAGLLTYAVAAYVVEPQLLRAVPRQVGRMFGRIAAPAQAPVDDVAVRS